jgi:hypothetical protein
VNGRGSVALLVWILVSAAPAFAVDKLWQGATSSWTTGSNWSPAGAPGAADRAVIRPGFVPPVLAASTTINRLEVQAGSTLTISAGVTLTLNASAEPVIDGTGTVVTGAGGLLRVSGAPGNGVLINQSMTLGALQIALPVFSDSVRINEGISVVFNGSLTITTGRLRVGTAGSGAPVTIDLNGDLNIVITGLFNLRSPGSLLYLAGNWVQDGTWQAGTNSTVTFDGAADQVLDIDRRRVAQFDFENLAIANTVGTVTYQNNDLTSTPNGLNVQGNLSVLPGARFIVQDYAVIGNAAADVFGIGSGAVATFQFQVDIDCTLSFDIDGGADDGLLLLQGTQYPPLDGTGFGTSQVPGNGTVRLNYSGNGTLPCSGATFNILELDMPGAGSGLLGLRQLTVDGGFTARTLRLTAGQFSIPAATVTITGSVDSSPAGTSILDFTGSGTIQVAGNVDLDHYSQGPGSTLRFNGAAPQTLLIRAATATAYHDFDGFEVMGGAVVTVLDNPNANFLTLGTLTIRPGGTLIVTDTFDPDGPVTFPAGLGGVLRIEGPLIADTSILGTLFTAGSGTVVYGGGAVNHTVYTRSNGVTIPYFHLGIDTSGGRTATQESAGLLRVNGTFSIMAAASVFTSAAGNMAVAGGFVCNGTFNHASAIVTFDGTGSITGTSPSLLFNQMLVNGPTSAVVVTAARSFDVASLFQVQQGTLGTAGLATPIVLRALSGVSAGNGAGAAGTAVFSLEGPATLAVQPGTAFTVNATDGRFAANSNGSGTPTLTRNGAAGTFDAVVSGQIDVRRLNFSFGDLEGLELAAAATVLNLRNVAFSNVNAAVGSRALTVRSGGAGFDAPGCTFAALPAGTFNVWAQDTTPADAVPLRVRLENRGLSPAAGGGGAGAGDAFDADDDSNDDGVPESSSANHGGAVVQWVYTANVDMSGTIQGFPMAAFDWSTFVTYSTYVIMRDSSGPDDRIYVLDGEGDLKPYSFPGPSDAPINGNVLGPLFWTSEGIEHVVYFGTSTGRVYRLVDTGSSLTFAASGPWTTPFSSASLDEVSSPLISDGTYLYFGGVDNGTNGIYRLSISPRALSAPVSTGNFRVVTAPAWADGATTRYLYCGTFWSGGSSHLYRVHVGNWVIEADYRDSSYTGSGSDMESDVVALVNVPTDTLYVGELNGFMHALPALGTAAEFIAPRPGFPFRDGFAGEIRGGAVVDFATGRLIYGNGGGHLYTVKTALTGPPVLDTDYYRLSTGAAAIRTMPLALGGMIYASNSAGRLFAVDAFRGAAPWQTVVMTWNLGTAALGDVSFDVGGFRVNVGSASGRFYSLPLSADPTGAFP